MNTAQPIRNRSDLDSFRDYYRKRNQPRNQLLITLGLNTALRISDLLSLRWRDVYDEGQGRYFSHISLVEQKTGKNSCIYLNENVLAALDDYRSFLKKQEQPLPEHDRYLFAGASGAPLSRVQAYRIVRRAAEDCQITGTICPHSLRKTFGYHAWKQGVSPALLMDIYNHSSFSVTQRYLGIDQDDRDSVFRKIRL